MQTVNERARSVALAGMVASGLLAIAKIWIGIQANSTSAVADGMESAADVIASGIVVLGLLVAARPADEDHPYGHGRYEILAGLGVGILLLIAGFAISSRSIWRIGKDPIPPSLFAIWPVLASLCVKVVLSVLKMRQGRKLDSSALVADAKNDAVDVISSTIALIAIGLTLHDPVGMIEADHIGGAIVGVIVGVLGLSVIRDTAGLLVDTMPEPERLAQIRSVAMTVDGARNVEKCYARKTGFQYHVDLHLEVDPLLTVRASHAIAQRVKYALKETLPWVADVLVHVEPYEIRPK